MVPYLLNTIWLASRSVLPIAFIVIDTPLSPYLVTIS